MSHNITTVPEGYCGLTRWDWMQSLVRVLAERGNVGRYIRERGWDWLPSDYKHNYPDPDPANYRTWFCRESSNAPMHPAIKQAVMLAPPADWHLLVLEHPHAADMDPTRIAYTRSDAHGEADRQTVTSVGKYLTRHFPSLRDHQIRDIVMRHGAYKFEIWDTVSAIVRSVQDGPHSCMCWGDFDRDTDTHPYEAYHPDYGWRAAVRLDDNGIITARCLVNVSETPPVFVRSYTRKDNAYSHSDEAIEVWLRDQGFEKVNSWEGLKLKRITKGRYNDDFWAPYLDGDCKWVEDCGDHLLISDDGDYECDRTDGHANGSSRCTCDDCGERHREDDMHGVGYHGDRSVGPCCVDDYAYVNGRNGDSYLIHGDEAICVDGEYYDRDYLARYDIVELDDGDYVHQSDAVYLESRDIWVRHDDECAVYCEGSGSYEHIDDCVQLEDGDWALESDAWQCEHDEKWYLNEEDSVETPCGKTVHAKYEDEYATETNAEEN